MRRFRFVGEPNAYLLDGSNIEMFIIGDDYSGPVIDHLKSKYPNDWEEVFEPTFNHQKPFTADPNPLHKDTDLGYYAGLAMQGLLANTHIIEQYKQEYIAELSISAAKELIKQLNEETK